MQFEWDLAKAVANILKHGVSFDEASTVFGDTLSVSGRDLEHSVSEARLVTIGLSSEGRVLIVCHTDRSNVFASTVLALQSERRRKYMKKAKPKDDEMRAEYRREDLGPLVRGKYAARYAKSTNIVVIDPKLTKVFPNSDAVNDALRSLLAIASKATGITSRSSGRATKRRAA